MKNRKLFITVSVLVGGIFSAFWMYISPTIREATTFPIVPVIAVLICGIFMGVGTYSAFMYFKKDL